MLRKLTIIVIVVMFIVLTGAGGGAYVLYKFGLGLPDYKQLADYEPPITTRVHAGDGRLLAEYAEEKRVFVPQDVMPRLVIQAFLSAEDKNFFYHPGVDPKSIARAIISNVKNIFSGRRLVGASTITQQVAKNFLLTADVTVERKIKEAILAFRIERALDKERILELYLNEIYLGFGSYGVAAAALNYFNKSLDRLTLAEAAFLAALPKAPNNYNPFNYPNAARDRRNWVIRRMQSDGAITAEDAQIAVETSLITRRRQETEYVTAEYFAEEVRRQLSQQYGETGLYRDGLVVRTTLDPKYQKIADNALRNGLLAYDRRHGWRGPLANIEPSADWLGALSKVAPPKGLGEWRLAVVTKILSGHAEINIDDGRIGLVPFAEMKWARRWVQGQLIGPIVKSVSEVLQVGDVIPVEPALFKKNGSVYPNGMYHLRQIPEIDGAVVALDPHTGRILAMSGGFSYKRSQFNRAVQARRQPGSAFKPFVYLAALDKGFTPSTLILDAPFVIDQGPGLPKWRPANYTKKFYGPSTMRLGIEKSRNLMTVRLAQTIGIKTIADYAQKFGIVDKLPNQLSMSLGAGETTLLKLTAAYAMLVNGGKRIKPTLLDRIQDRHGKTVFKHDPRDCEKCRLLVWQQQPVPAILDHREQVADPSSAYQMVSMLEGVVQRGTGRTMRALGKPLAGKTGTTNRALDTWFIGFSPDLAVGVFVGFDIPRSLGKREQGASVSAPIFKEFMKNALFNKPSIPFRIPPGIRLVRVDAGTGRLARSGDKRIILEAFKPGTVPKGQVRVLDGYENPRKSAPTIGIGGLY
jgi:penicillin-binding protein 1A